MEENRVCATCKHLDFCDDCDKIKDVLWFGYNHYGWDGYSEVETININEPDKFGCMLWEEKDEKENK